jgi:hypothetical protein
MPPDRTDRLKPPPEPTEYEVGYGKPPRASRFTPGQSGNPKGRPKGARNKPVGTGRLTDIILSEAYRSIKVNEGKTQISVPMVTAVMRTLAINAARGQTRSQQLFSKLLADAERAHELTKMQTLDAAVNYKHRWEAELERRKSLGTTGPEPIPHPDDVRINMRTGEVTIVGPWTKEEKAKLDYWYDQADQYDSDIQELSANRQKIKSKKVRAHADRQIAHAREMREQIVSAIGEPSQRRKS